MQKVKIGVLDHEREYVMNLIVYLQKYGKGKWDLYAFTNEEALNSYEEKKKLDLLVGTDKRVLVREKDMERLWLSDNREDNHSDIEKLYIVYRFQSAEEIAKAIEGIVKQKERELLMDKPVVAVYSPIGRCGKTTLALEVVKGQRYGKWLYIGMEDYSSFDQEWKTKQLQTDELIYYWKEKKIEKVLSLVEQGESLMITGTSFFDVKQLQEEDIQWFKKLLEQVDYRGVIYDIGSGVLGNIHTLQQFDYILVPYIGDEKALIKKRNFEELLGVHGFEKDWNKLFYLNMDKKAEVDKIMRRIFGGEMW